MVNTVTNCVCSSNFVVGRAGECDASSAATASSQYDYDSYESCRVDFTQPVTLTKHLFETEGSGGYYSGCYDYVEVGGTQYCTSGTNDGNDLNGLRTSRLDWTSDYGVNAKGFIICFS